MKTPEQIRHARPVWWWPAPWPRCVRRSARREHGRPRRDGRRESARPGARPPSGLSRLPRVDLHLGQRGHRARHPPRGRCCARVTSLDRLRRDRRRLARRCGDHRRGRRGRPELPGCSGVRGRDVAGPRAAQAGRRLTDISHAVEAPCAAPASTASSRTTAATASAPHAHGPARPQLRPPRTGPAAGRGHGARHRADDRSRRRRDRRLADEWTVVTADGSCAAHCEHTVAIPADGPWVLTAPGRRRRRFRGHRPAVGCREGT